VRRLIEAGATVDFRADRAAMTALMIAGGRESIEVLDALLAGGANPKLRSSSGFTALMHAVFEGRTENVRRLIAAGADAARDRETLLRMAREKGHAEIAALLEAVPAP
jgi:ankyrin repeat protein